MRVLLDECIDARFAPHVTGFDTRTVVDQGWSGISSGKLLALAQAGLDVFVTVDKNLSFQQHLPKFSIAVILIHCKSNRVQNLLPLLPTAPSLSLVVRRRSRFSSIQGRTT